MSSMSVALRLMSVVLDYSLYTISILTVIGIIGNLINILVFMTLKLFRSSQSAFYLTAESFINIGQLIIIFLGRYLITFYGRDPAKTSIFWCKMRNILGQIFRLLSTSFVCFAAFDQFLSTNPRLNLRQLSTLTLARRLTIVSTCFWIFHSIPLAIYVNIDSSATCGITNDGLKNYYSIFYFPFVQGFLPIIFSSLFSILAYRNVRHLIRRQIPIIRRRLDRQLTAMVFVRVIFFTILSLPYSIYCIYILNASNDPEVNFCLYAVNKLLEVIFVSLLNINYASSFFIFIKSSARYSRQVKSFFARKCWKLLKRLCRIHPNVVHSLPSTSNVSANELE
ncbi:unnamed protein product [Rotaria magnacalcarata]|uniref:G-protein coupled receptors family 1 profile domain-containing protein n=1 Tax=Rotaria magnacalcarata TaxID=392030 RepID=A0A818YFU1_9BILA|nr:unnamed protein product [Rotaria magnacalcarata]CAF4211472.1 unnamed protein product [Rotaria magnacalcarata]